VNCAVREGWDIRNAVREQLERFDLIVAAGLDLTPEQASTLNAYRELERTVSLLLVGLAGHVAHEESAGGAGTPVFPVSI